MGMDVAFNRKQAIAAGLQISIELNGTPGDIARAEADEADGMPNQPGYLDWLKTEETVIHVPGTDLRVIDNGASEHIVVRANKWGYVYEPLTNWLKANGIEWSEF